MKQLHGMEISLLSCQLCNLDFGAFGLEMFNLQKTFKKQTRVFYPLIPDFILKSNNLKFSALCLDSAECICLVFPTPQFFSHSPRNVWLGKPIISPASSPYEPKLPV